MKIKDHGKEKGRLYLKNHEASFTLLVDHEFRGRRRQDGVERHDGNLAAPVTLFLHVDVRKVERAVATKITVAREFVEDNLGIAAV